MESTYETAARGASLAYPVQCSGLRPNGHVLSKGPPCKIIDMFTSKPDKHGHAKINLTGVEIFTGKKYEDVRSSPHTMDIPRVDHQDYTLIDIDGVHLNLMATDGTMKDDVKLPENNIGVGVKAAFDDGRELLLTIVSAMNEESPVAFRDAPR